MAAMIGYELDLFVGKDWHIDQFDACDWSLCIFAVFSLVNIQFVYALQAPCHTSRISQSLNWENGILTICWAGFKFHWLRGEMLLLDCSSRAEDIGAFNLFQQVDFSEERFLLSHRRSKDSATKWSLRRERKSNSSHHTETSGSMESLSEKQSSCCPPHTVSLVSPTG